ncbi:hypothetical protein C882_3895 [Caenispirillum salinarum AK4]|uniref:Uncharacterized protein n=1 Tax=Caenispirillum salinarum AK4 TaxID=1238182 RepID=K9H1T2_9PROT|nr:hypothetical protein [Caenispirillum salinarum]EKV31522.1 hypothetical protein C882_3895 [Caenispirillum salinarum AK4]
MSEPRLITDLTRRELERKCERMTGLKVPAEGSPRTAWHEWVTAGLYVGALRHFKDDAKARQWAAESLRTFLDEDLAPYADELEAGASVA